MTTTPEAMAGTRHEHIRKTYEKTFPFVLFVLRKLRVPEADIEELAHDVYMSFIRIVDSITPEKTTAWLATTARNKAFDHFRKSESRRTSCDMEGVATAEETLWSPCQGDSERLANAHSLFGALARWEPEGRRSVLGDYYVEGKSTRRIAEERGVKVPTVTSALCRERRRFRSFVESQGFGR